MCSLSVLCVVDISTLSDTIAVLIEIQRDICVGVLIYLFSLLFMYISFLFISWGYVVDLYVIPMYITTEISTVVHIVLLIVIYSVS